MLLIVALNILFPDKDLTVTVPALAFFAAAVMLFALVRYVLIGLKIMRGEEVEGTIELEKGDILPGKKSREHRGKADAASERKSAWGR